MAQYGYSAGYQGGGPQAVPSGFIEAYSQAGRNIGQGVQAIGSAIGESLQRYGQNKQENEFLQTRLETLAPYLNTVAQSGNIMDKNTPESKLLGDIEKFSSMSLAQKKATLLNAEFFLDRADKAKAREMTDAALAQQLKLGQYNINAIESKLKQDEILSGAIQFGSNQPTTTTQTEQVTDTINFPPIPGRVTPAVMATPSQAEATAARYYMGRYGQAAQDLQRYGSDIGAKANALDVSQIRRFTGPISLGQEDPEAYINQQFESPIVAAARIEANTRLKQQQLRESEVAMQQAGIMSRSPALQTIGQRTLQPAQETPPIQQPPETRTRNVSTQVPISYEDQSKRLTQYLVQQGAKPETLAMVPQILSMVGQQRPMQIESKTLPSGITVVRADGKIDILAAPKPIEGKPLNESQGKAASFAAGMKLNNDTINSVFKSGYSPKSLTELGFMPERLKTDSRKSYETSRDAWIENFLRDRSGAVISPEEYPATEKQYFPMAGDSEKIVKQKEAMRIDAMNNTMKKAGQHADDYVNQISNQPKSGVLKYNTATKRFE
jgi:hypothetical protein